MESMVANLQCKELLSVDFFDWFNEGITMLKPNKKKIGVTEIESDWSSENHQQSGDNQTAEQFIGDLGNMVTTDTEVEIIDDSENATLLDALERSENSSGIKNDTQLLINDCQTNIYRPQSFERSFETSSRNVKEYQ